MTTDQADIRKLFKAAELVGFDFAQAPALVRQGGNAAGEPDALESAVMSRWEPVQRAFLDRCLFSAKACFIICQAELKNSEARINATIRSDQAVPVIQTPDAAANTTKLPMASLRLHNQTDLTLASPSLYFIRNSTLTRLATKAIMAMLPMVRASGELITNNR